MYFMDEIVLYECVCCMYGCVFVCIKDELIINIP